LLYLKINSKTDTIAFRADFQILEILDGEAIASVQTIAKVDS